MSHKSKELLLDACILCFAIGGFLFVNPTGAAVTEGPGGLSWRSLPLLYSGLLLALALFSIGSTLLAPEAALAPDDEETEALEEAAEGEGGGEEESDTVHAIRRAGVIVVLLAYTQGLVYLGFALTTPVFLFALLVLFGRRNMAENVLVSLLGGALLWVLFSYLLHMPLKGSLWDPLTPALTAAMRAIGA